MRMQPECRPGQRRRSRDSGQVLAEACIGLALMVFAWLLLTYASFLGTNHIRTAMAARHAAWLRGSNPDGADPSVAAIEEAFFFQTGLLKVTPEAPEGIISLLTGNKDRQHYGSSGKGPYRFLVTFGVPAAELASTDQMPFRGSQVRPPFMAETASLGISEVSSGCQWDSIGDTWNTPGAVLSAAWSALKGIVSRFF